MLRGPVGAGGSNMIAQETHSRLGVVVSWLAGSLHLCCGSLLLVRRSHHLVHRQLDRGIDPGSNLSALLVVVSFAAMWSRSKRAYQPFLAASLLLGIAYLTFMCTVDIPMYVSQLAGRRRRRDENICR